MKRREFLKGAALTACAASFAETVRAAEPSPGRYFRRLDDRYAVDVCVAGAGPAGLAAAVMAARRGVKTLLLEAGTCFGGCGTQAGIPMFCMPTDGIHETSAGFGSEVYRRIIDEGAAMPGTTQENKYKWGTLHFRCEAVKRVYDEIVTEAKVGFLFGVRVVDAETDAAGRVTRLVCAGKEGLFAVRAKVFVDATGDADLTHFAGAESEYGDEEGNVQASTLPSVWAGIDWKTANAKGGGMWTHQRHLKQAFEDGVFRRYDPHLPGLFMSGETSAYGNAGHVWTNGTKDRSLSDAYVEGRRLLAEYERYYRRYIPGFEKAELVASGALMGVRESRRIVGDYRMTVGDYVARRHFDDDIGSFSYPIDLHAAKPDAKLAKKALDDLESTKYKPGENYGIPYRALLPKGLANVLVAGRCVSCDRAVQASLRVMPACFITGQAAGLAAALASSSFGGEVRTVPYVKLRAAIESVGGHVNFKKMSPS